MLSLALALMLGHSVIDPAEAQLRQRIDTLERQIARMQAQINGLLAKPEKDVRFSCIVNRGDRLHYGEGKSRVEARSRAMEKCNNDDPLSFLCNETEVECEEI